MKMHKFVIFVKKNLKINMVEMKITVKLGTITIIQENVQVIHIAYSILKKFNLVFYNRFNYDYHFIMKGLGKASEG